MLLRARGGRARPRRSPTRQDALSYSGAQLRWLPPPCGKDSRIARPSRRRREHTQGTPAERRSKVAGGRSPKVERWRRKGLRKARRLQWQPTYTCLSPNLHAPSVVAAALCFHPLECWQGQGGVVPMPYLQSRISQSILHLPLDFIGEPGGTRTRDPMIKSHVLYRLSYGLGAPLHTEKLRAFPALRLRGVFWGETRPRAAWFPA
jgi:hypothetical protein